jgi:hypothetical protein
MSSQENFCYGINSLKIFLNGNLSCVFLFNQPTIGVDSLLENTPISKEKVLCCRFGILLDKKNIRA